MNNSGDHGYEAGGWTIVVPVKSLDRAKSRLGPSLSPDSRRTLAMAMAADVVSTCVATPGVSAVRVVSSDPEVAALATRLGAEFVVEGHGVRRVAGDGDGEGDGRSDPLNAALAVALDGVPGPVGVVTADLPELDSGLLGRVLRSAARHPHSIVADHQGEGTTMAFWAATHTGDRVCRFGVDSARRFRDEGGAVAIPVTGPSWDAASRDVDVPGDLSRLRGRRVGAATSIALHHDDSALPSRPDRRESATMVW